mmetsp:Transcript_26486/g.58066  ORF Transcript_26486/g.58066 Transcript_26486/m.58066 type:complete len:159 (+) Transcript_26486:227-703(+)
MHALGLSLQHQHCGCTMRFSKTASYPKTASYHDVSRFSPTLSTLVNTFASIHSSTLLNTSSLAFPFMSRWVASSSSIMNFLPTLFVSLRCLTNCVVGGSHVSRYPADGRSDEDKDPPSPPTAVAFFLLLGTGDLERDLPLGIVANAICSYSSSVTRRG